ncbi:PAK4-inhibitor INKA2-like isoform X1 [Electrophorus electricus]|uniref:PAK4-inhibitor INKA2-like isoform X1 n=2 Tax=Electrophorus electricus TaxID=8005 RepID=UPI0015CFE9CA|nr:PAK4-inhibitor INKA2-like isoform X1 [Electrophorus electricus]
MDACLKLLRQELLSMTEAGDGLHDQMLSMMGALQELKLLQVQTALEQLELSGKSRATSQAPANSEEQRCNIFKVARRQEKQGHPQNPHSCITGTSPSASSMGSESTALPRRISGWSTPRVEYCSPSVCQPSMDQHAKGQNSIQPSELSPADLSGILHSLSREGPSLDNNYTEDSFDRSRDWTSTLMSCSRNRQPLVLGDNVLADLVGNWLDLPDLEKEAEFGLCGSDCPTCPLQLGRPQELSKRFSLTGNLFKKLLRSVRPDREKLLKQKPGWMPPRSDREAELVKRPKKAAKAKGSFYLPFWSGSQQAKGSAFHQPPDDKTHFLELYIDGKLGEPMEKVQPLFDYSTAVWV